MHDGGARSSLIFDGLSGAFSRACRATQQRTASGGHCQASQRGGGHGSGRCMTSGQFEGGLVPPRVPVGGARFSGSISDRSSSVWLVAPPIVAEPP